MLGQCLVNIQLRLGVSITGFLNFQGNIHRLHGQRWINFERGRQVLQLVP